MTSIPVVHGVTLPMRPMLPVVGRRLNTVRAVDAFNATTLSGTEFIVQPCLTGTRCMVGVVGGKLHVFPSGQANPPEILNASTILKKCHDLTALDGVVHEGLFFVTDVLAFSGRSFIHRSASERCALAFSFNKLFNNPFHLGTPSPEWLLKRLKNSPRFSGVVIKESSSRYISPSNDQTRALTWVFRAW